MELTFAFFKALTFAFCGLMWWRKPKSSGKTIDFGQVSTGLPHFYIRFQIRVDKLVIYHYVTVSSLLYSLSRPHYAIQALQPLEQVSWIITKWVSHYIKPCCLLYSILILLRCLFKFDPMTKDEPIHHAQVIHGEISPFHRFTNPRHDKSVYNWQWTSYLLFIRKSIFELILC